LENHLKNYTDAESHKKNFTGMPGMLTGGKTDRPENLFHCAMQISVHSGI
jgi:hypothetical protein